MMTEIDPMREVPYVRLRYAHLSTTVEYTPPFLSLQGVRHHLDVPNDGTSCLPSQSAIVAVLDNFGGELAGHTLSMGLSDGSGQLYSTLEQSFDFQDLGVGQPALAFCISDLLPVDLGASACYYIDIFVDGKRCGRKSLPALSPEESVGVTSSNNALIEAWPSYESGEIRMEWGHFLEKVTVNPDWTLNLSHIFEVIVMPRPVGPFTLSPSEIALYFTAPGETADEHEVTIEPVDAGGQPIGYIRHGKIQFGSNVAAQRCALVRAAMGPAIGIPGEGDFEFRIFVNGHQRGAVPFHVRGIDLPSTD